MDKQALWMFSIEMRLDFLERLMLKTEMGLRIAGTAQSADESLPALLTRIGLNERMATEAAELNFRDDQPALAAHADEIRTISDNLRAIAKQIAEEMMGRRLRQV